MNKLKILLGDPRHNTVGAHSYFIPIGIGYIGANLLENFKGVEVDLKLSTEPKEIFELLENWKPDIIGISNYIWNSNLSNFICEKAKELNKNTLCILGGPEFPAGTGARFIKNTALDKTYDKSLKFMQERKSVDYFAYCDGETAFLEAVRIFFKNNLSVEKLKNDEIVIAGCANLSRSKNELLVGEYIDRIGAKGSVKNEGRDVIPSPYTTGLLDKYLDGKYVPAFETARGCPFQCTFCDQGLDQTKITTFSVKRLAEEMEYVGEKLSKIKDATKTIFIFDANWGIFEKDVKLANEILKTMNKYDWPQYIECLTPKSNWDNLLKINDILKNRVQLSLSMQSLKVETLKDIKRTNWTIEQYLDFINEVKKRGKPTASEMIIPLPNETEESYFEGVKFFMDNHVQTRTWTLMMLIGTDLGRDFGINKYGMIAKHRILPKEFGEYYGRKIFEIEKACVGTNSMSYQNYLNCRNYSFILKLLGHSIFVPVHDLVEKIGLSWFDFSRQVADALEKNKVSGKFKDLYDEFCKESHNELFKTREEAIEFYTKEENYKLLLDGSVGENLQGKYQGKSFLILEAIFEVLFFVIRQNVKDELRDDLMPVLDSCEKWLKNLYLIDSIMKDDNNKIPENYIIEINFNFPEWLKQKELSFENFRENVSYKFNYDKEKIDYIRNEIKTVQGDKERALSRYLDRRHMLGFNLFEKNYTRIN